MKDFKTIEEERCSATLLCEIKRVSYEYDGYRNLYLVLDIAKAIFFKYIPKENKSNTVHFNTFRALVEVVEYHSSNIADDDALITL